MVDRNAEARAGLAAAIERLEHEIAELESSNDRSGMLETLAYVRDFAIDALELISPTATGSDE